MTLWRPVSVYGSLTRLETTLITVTLVSVYQTCEFLQHMASSELSLAMFQPFWHADPSTEHTLTPKHTHAHRCVKCGVMQNVAVWCIMRPIYGDPKCGVEYMECGVMWNGMRDVARCICGCDLKFGIAKWHNVLWEVLVWYERCDMVKNDGVPWNMVWFGICQRWRLMWNDAM